MTDAPRPPRRVLREQQLRRKSLKWTLRLRSLDPRPRRDPDFVVVGAQKAGSTSLFAYLAAHPEVAQPLVKEINYFDLWPARGHSWYRRHFPVDDGSGRITGEASPMYMVHPLALDRIARDLPRVKIVVILRDPITRLLSHYRHSVRLGHEYLTLSESLLAEEARLAPDLELLKRDPFHPAFAFQHFSYLRRSLYANQVARIRELWPSESVFLRLESLDQPELKSLSAFLGIGYRSDLPFQAHNVNVRVASPDVLSLPQDVTERIRADGERTCAMLGWEPWDL